MTLRVLFASHDGYGLGHTRRNARLAAALLRRVSDAQVWLLTGIKSTHPWLTHPGLTVHRLPSLTKDNQGNYRHSSLSPRQALDARRRAFEVIVGETQPQLVVLDRHPFGIAGELRPGLALARQHGARVVLGLRDILDEPGVIRRELASEAWFGAGQVLDQILVYGNQALCDHQLEYGLPGSATYCGIVVDPPEHRTTTQRLVITAGGGADGRAVSQLGRDLVGLTPFPETVIVSGPSATPGPANARAGLVVHPQVADCANLYAGAAATVQMAGYNSTYEAIVAGIRPVLVPRRSPRREQAIRATRLTSLGLADLVDFGSTTEEVAWLLRQPRRLTARAAIDRGISLEGVATATSCLLELTGTDQRDVA